ncbi:uncharacterized protein LOC119069968 isoform X2 [Bradysia coprophila]|uniref:uncharacterized protein LOC119069968 isoform X2 n=1 Tax=Bradysia coprophila TaxID=38358 RepID=UPI00187D98F5|nr:uncharacterized protein LOC119069968 isoform X2 [Bradysia coprophila]
MDLKPDEDQEILKRRLQARYRFRSLGRKVMANAKWLNEIEDRQIGTNPRRNISIIVRRSGVKGILTLKDKTIFNTPDQYRNEKDREHLKSTVNSLKCFQIIPQKFQDCLVKSCNFSYFNSGRLLTREGHYASAIYFLLDGEVTVSKRVYSIGDGKWIDDVRYALVPGDVFGLDGVIFGDKRTVSCTTAINTELLYIYKDDLSDELRKTLTLHWDNIKTALRRFSYYFAHFAEQQITECCTFSKIKQYNVDDVIYDGGDGQRNNTFLIISGQCMILQCIEIPYHPKTNNQKHNIVMRDVRKHTNNSKVLPQKRLDRTDATRMPLGHVRFEDRQKYSNNWKSIENHRNLQETKQVIFVDIATLSAGSIFSIGEDMVERSIVAKNIVQCLEIPTFWLLERAQNIGNIWNRTKIFYTVTIPGPEAILEDYRRSCRWNRYKKEIIEKLLG